MWNIIFVRPSAAVGPLRMAVFRVDKRSNKVARPLCGSWWIVPGIQDDLAEYWWVDFKVDHEVVMVAPAAIVGLSGWMFKALNGETHREIVE